MSSVLVDMPEDLDFELDMVTQAGLHKEKRERFPLTPVDCLLNDPY